MKSIFFRPAADDAQPPVAAKLGDVLSATAAEVSRNRKLGVYRIAITREDAGAAVLIASFTGTAFITERDRVDDLGSAAAALGLGVDHDLGFPVFLGSVPPPAEYW